ncbi:protein import receptor MAS20 [Meredithblackwellia eburnea MCA 4105]
MVQQVNYSQIAGATAATAALGLVSYCIYFDYKRRNDKQFRHRLLKEQKKIAQVDQKQQQQGKEAIQAALRRALTMINAEPVPTDVAAREQYFMEQVGLGEQLAARSPEHYVASAISFYRALKVYPAPHELIMIYQKTQPAVVFDLVMEMIGLE